MSFKVEIDSADAELLAILKTAKATGCTAWDTTICHGVTLKVSITHPLSVRVPNEAIDSVNRCISSVFEAFKSAAIDGAPASEEESR